MRGLWSSKLLPKRSKSIDIIEQTCAAPFWKGYCKKKKLWTIFFLFSYICFQKKCQICIPNLFGYIGKNCRFHWGFVSILNFHCLYLGNSAYLLSLGDLHNLIFRVIDQVEDHKKKEKKTITPNLIVSSRPLFNNSNCDILFTQHRPSKKYI